MKDRAMVTIDFLVGFTIFISAFIIVVAMVPHPLFSVQSARIDYDAVAYRTGVILVEDPGMPAPIYFTVSEGARGWEQQMDPKDVIRMGLAVERGSPHILSPAKVDRFFDRDFFTYPDDYQRSLIFGDYPYSFNVTLSHKGTQRSVGPIPPEQYGVVRRVVVVKETSSLIRDGEERDHNEFHEPENNNSDQRLSVKISYDILNDRSVPPLFIIDPRVYPLRIQINNLSAYLNTSGDLILKDHWIDHSRFGNITTSLNHSLVMEEDLEELTFILSPMSFTSWQSGDTIVIVFSFDKNPDGADEHTIIYDYRNVTLPDPGVATLEVAVW